MNKQTIALSSDHGAFEMCRELSVWLKNNGYEVLDFGTMTSESCDYPDFAYKAAEAVSISKADVGIIICGSGQGMQMTANKVKNIRAAHCHTKEMAEITRKHNDANVLTFGARFLDISLAKEIIKIFLNTEFEGDRHINRINKIHSLTGV